MIRRLPVIPTLIVLAAVAVMIRLGFWQIDRMHQKEVLLARYAAAGAMSAEVPWSGDPRQAEDLLYRRVRLICDATVADQPIAGHDSKGNVGWAQIQNCNTREGFGVRVVIGWAKEPYAGDLTKASSDARLLNRWHGGVVTGVLGPGPKLVADPPLAGLKANARPDPSSIPNNHWSYAMQWFLFAVVALVIYGLAVRKRLKT
jgi:cytochrome oxidase assembly protein ShyY1